MSEKRHPSDETQKKKTILGLLLARSEPDREYISDLKAQWSVMNAGERRQFILGAVIGLILFIVMIGAGIFLILRIIG
jgi:hypothetical protein